MNYTNIMKAYNKLADDESRKWFDARVKHALHGKITTWWDNIYDIGESWHFYGADIGFLSSKRYLGKKLVIFGAGKYGKHALFIIRHSDLANRVVAFIDNCITDADEVCGLPVWRPLRLMESPDDYVVVIGSDNYGMNMYRQLCFMGFPQTNIYMPREGRFVGCVGHQYFDMFSSMQEEIFIDAGCYDGQTSCDFVKWCNGDYNKIYAFEPSDDMAAVCLKKISSKDIKRFELFQKVCWSESCKVDFSVSEIRSASSVVGQNGDMDAISIDEVLDGAPVTFMKFDVEGSELQALKGAQKSIKKYKPRLAISLYHKPDDILEIPAYVIGLNEDYRLYIRHYTSDIWETVLYAI